MTMTDGLPSQTTPPVHAIREWSRIARSHAQPNITRSIFQLSTAAIALTTLWIAMMLTVDGAYWATLLLSIPAAAFTVRLFIIQHDCGHRSFFKSRWLNDIVGSVIGIITLTPHNYWRRAHNTHHATCGNLQKRGIGDVSVLTVAEYLSLPRWKRIAYRIYREPAVLLALGPTYLFALKYRLPMDLIRDNPRLLFGVMATNFGITAALVALGLGFGFVDVLMVHLPIMLLSSTTGVFLFYIQHQFENTHWYDDDNWDFHRAAVFSSSYFVLPQPLRWITGDIGIHHLHHLSSRVPNYNLNTCLKEIPALQHLNRISLRDGLALFRLALWDQNAGRLIPFKRLPKASRARPRKPDHL